MGKTNSIKFKIYFAFGLLDIFIVLCDLIIGLDIYRKNSEHITGMVEVIIIFGLVCLATSFITEFYIIKKIMKPVKAILSAVQQVRIGNVEIQAEKVSNDEFGEVADNINEMIASIRRQVDIANQIAAGNLTVEIHPRSDKDVLAFAFIDIVNKNNVALSGIRESTIQVTAGSGQVADASQALAQGSTEQASAIEQITASMEDIANKTKDNAEQATLADNIAHDVRSGAERGQGQMKDMMDAMNSINDSSDKISKVIKTIDDIAFQTNILALNATVEAARAGVHGKGFAVVAEEVRNLAEKSAAAAKETSDMIEDSITRVKHGTELAVDTSKAFDTIVTSIAKCVDLIDHIATASNNQATAITQINQAINQVSQVVQTNSATSEECASASEELANQAESLRSMTGKYKLKDNSYSGMASSGDMGSGFSHSSYQENDNEQIISLDGGFGKY